jgi:hypothetical protein
MESVGRMFLCARCRERTVLCSRCDRAHMTQAIRNIGLAAAGAGAETALFYFARRAVPVSSGQRRRSLPIPMGIMAPAAQPLIKMPRPDVHGRPRLPSSQFVTARR